jgi:hypothetical protein
MRSIAPILALSLGCNVPLARADDAKVTVTISRQYPGNKCTSGYLAVDGKIIAYALERPWLDNLNDISAIPAGKYKAHLRYDKGDHWRIQLDGVPNRKGVQIHVGNQPDQSKGCVLVGEKLDSDLCSLEGSKKAYAKLKKAFYGSEEEGAYDPRDIVVEIVGDQKPTK